MRWRILGKIKTTKKPDRQKEIIKALFRNRGLRTKKQKEEFLKPKNPYKLTPKDVGISAVQLSKAISRIKKALKNKEKIVVYGDYDADGICAAAIIWETLHRLGADVMPFIPTREEGYGLKVDRLDQMLKNGVKLVITVDQGIVHLKQVAHAQKKGVDVIVTDHHVPGKSKPRAKAIVHTTELAGAGVVWFLARELKKNFRDGGAPRNFGRRHLGGKTSLDLATIGTVADVRPLIGPDRSIVKHGLNSVRQTERLGLLALYNLAGLDKEKIGAYEVGFIIGPRLNATGRMEDPMDSLRLVCTQSKTRAADLAQKIDQRNRERQSLTNQSTLHAKEFWLKEDGRSALIFVHHQSYQEGIVGLVASRLKDEFYRPAVIVAQGKEWSKASARSINEFNIIEAVRACADLLGDHGGHPQAAGFSVETTKLELLKQRLVNLAEKQLDKKKLQPVLKIDAEVNLADIDFDFYRQIEKLAPFGEGNPQPVFVTRQVKVVSAQTVGKNGGHLKLKLSPCLPERVDLYNAIGFRMGHLYERLSPEKPIDIAYNILPDDWRGQQRLQLRLKDIKFNL